MILRGSGGKKGCFRSRGKELWGLFSREERSPGYKMLLCKKRVSVHPGMITEGLTHLREVRGFYPASLRRQCTRFYQEFEFNFPAWKERVF